MIYIMIWYILAFIFLAGDLRGGKKYEKRKRRVNNAIEKKDRPELEDALADFEALLVTETVKTKETAFIVKIVEQKEILIETESMRLQEYSYN